MVDTFRVASFNVENLFGRVKVFTDPDHSVGDTRLEKVDKLRKVLNENNYTALRKQKILDLYTDLKDYILIREDRGKLFLKHGWAIVGVKANGKGDWDGSIEFKKAKYSDTGRKNTAKVIKAVKADLACIVEADNRPSLKQFDTQLLNSRYRYEMLIDGNDSRGIDVGLYSKFPIGGVWTHMFERKGTKQIFSRDCLEVEVTLPNGKPLYILCNHFKSRGYDTDGTADTKRKRQATRVAEILKEKYKLSKDWVIVAGDLNDNPEAPPLKPLRDVNLLYDVLEVEYPNDKSKRWTYHYNKFEQIDYLLVSKPLKDRLRQAGVERRGMYKLKGLTEGSNGGVEVETQYNSVTHWTNAASDHGAVWAEFDL